VWTGQLLRPPSDVTAVDASPEMLAIAAAGVGNERVRLIEADLFTWKPDRRYDVVFFGFGSHTFRPNALHPSGRWWLTASTPGRVFFADDAYRTPDELTEGHRPQPSADRSLTEPPTGS
jgi:trans-aconitate methyltransferase